MTNTTLNMAKKLLLMIFALSINTTSLFAQLREDLKNELLVYIQPSVLEFPSNEQKSIEINSLRILSPALKSIFLTFGINELQKAFPNVKDADTIAISENGLEVSLPQISRIFVLRLKNISDVDLAIVQLSKIMGVLFAEKHSDMSINNDDYFSDQWYLNNTGQSGGIIDADIDAPEAWQIFNGSSSVKLGVIDTGVETTHDDLTGKSSGDLPENYPYDSYSHGTHVAGISGAKHNNIGKVRGVDANVLIKSKKVFSGWVYDPSAARDVAAWGGDNNAYNKIIEAVNEGANVLNNSYGGPTYSTTLRMAFSYAYKMNRVSVVSMGNKNSSTPSYPSAFGQGILAVGSTTDFDVRSYFSNYGGNIDVTAPGSSILSTWRGNDYNIISGTSMASPIVAGIATLLKGYNTNLFNDDIEQIIRISAEDKGDPGWDQYYGTGRVNAYNALRLLQSPYQLSQLSSYGGNYYANTASYNTIIYGASGLVDGVYIVERHEIRKNISFSPSTNINVWGRGVGTIGWSFESPNFSMGYCDVVPGTVTSTGATLRTYIYKVWSLSGSYLGYYPASPSNVNFNYSVLGIPLVAPVISNITQNPVPIYKGTYGYVYCNLAQGNGNLTYDWFSTNQPSHVSIVPEGYRCKIFYLPTETITPIEAPGWNFGCTVSNEDVSGWTDTKTFQPTLNPLLYGCPTLAFDNRGTLTSENPLLITSMSNPGKDVTDYYLINTPLTANNNKINLTIYEPQREHTWFDNVSLLETRANPDETLVVNDEGQVINYKGVLPARILLNGETDITQNLLELDSLSVELHPGDKLTISRNAVEGDGDIVINGEEGIPIAKRIPAMLMNVITQKQGLENDKELITETVPFTNFFLRPNKSTISKKLRNLPTGTIEITVNKKLTLDYFVFVTDLRTSKTKTLPLVSAVHNINGDIKSKLTGIDLNYADLYPTERIDLSFSTSTNSGNIAYILKTVGRYETDTTFVGKQNNLAKINEQPIVPTENKLYDNYPNPFNPSTIIKYTLKNDGRVTLKIFNTLGEEIRTLVDELKPAGNYEAAFNASNLPSGVYIYRMQSGAFVSSKKMLLIK